MPHSYTITDQVNFLEEWFDSWSEFQKEDFLPVLVQALNPGDNVNGLVDGIRSIQVGGQRRPSLFDCQIKLFQEWIDSWTEAEKNKFLMHVKDHDPEFNEKLNGSLVKDPVKIEVEDEQIPAVETSLPPDVVNKNERDDGVSQGSASISPLSSGSQPQSPHDSGMDEINSDLEALPQQPIVSFQEASNTVDSIAPTTIEEEQLQDEYENKEN